MFHFCWNVFDSLASHFMHFSSCAKIEFLPKLVVTVGLFLMVLKTFLDLRLDQILKDILFLVSLLFSHLY